MVLHSACGHRIPGTPSATRTPRRTPPAEPRTKCAPDALRVTRTRALVRVPRHANTRAPRCVATIAGGLDPDAQRRSVGNTRTYPQIHRLSTSEPNGSGYSDPSPRGARAVSGAILSVNLEPHDWNSSAEVEAPVVPIDPHRREGRRCPRRASRQPPPIVPFAGICSLRRQCPPRSARAWPGRGHVVASVRVRQRSPTRRRGDPRSSGDRPSGATRHARLWDATRSTFSPPDR